MSSHKITKYQRVFGVGDKLLGKYNILGIASKIARTLDDTKMLDRISYAKSIKGKLPASFRLELESYIRSM